MAQIQHRRAMHHVVLCKYRSTPASLLIAVRQSRGPKAMMLAVSARGPLSMVTRLARRMVLPSP